MKRTFFPLFVLTCLSVLFALNTQAQSTFQYDSNGNLTNVAATVAGPPTITAQPTSQSVYYGQDASLSVDASGPGPLSYQWYNNGVLIAGATNGTPVFVGRDKQRSKLYCRSV